MSSQCHPLFGFRDRLRLLSGVWAQKLTGTLEIFPSAQSSSPHQVSISAGGIVERERFSSLNMGLRKGRIRFIEGGQPQPADWTSLGRFLYQKAYYKVLRCPVPVYPPPPHRVLFSEESLLALLPEDEPRVLLDVSGLSPDDDRVSQLRAVAMMGLIGPITEQPVLPAGDGTRPPALLIPWPGPCTDEVEQRARTLLAAQKWGAARAMIEADFLVDMERPGLLFCLALAWLLDASKPLEERVDCAMRWGRFAQSLGPADPALKQYRELIRQYTHTLALSPAFYSLTEKHRQWLWEFDPRDAPALKSSV